MTQTVALPLWMVVIALILAAFAALDRILAPSVRWFFRRRMERAVARLNARLARPIEPFRLAQRHDLVLRLAYDPMVTRAAADHAAEQGIPPTVAFQQARTYAREIVPAFSATMYFGFAVQAARWLSQRFYRVRIVNAPPPPGDATVVFVMNHQSNMDYVLVTWLVSDHAAISYAVGEWARVWPLSRLIRATGAYFIRRGSKNALYRRVLARYVQMAAAEGVTQAFFPEGGLSLDGRTGPARLGLLSYLVQAADGLPRDILFQPVGLAYDRVIEDRLLATAARTGVRRFRPTLWGAAVFVLRNLWRVARGRFPGFGTAAAAYGVPVSLRGFLAEHPAGPEQVADLGAVLMGRIAAAIPVLPAPLIAATILTMAPRTLPDLRLSARALAERLAAGGAVLALPEGDFAELCDRSLRHLRQRDLVTADLRPAPGKEALLRFCAASVLQRAESVGDAASQQT